MSRCLPSQVVNTVNFSNHTGQHTQVSITGVLTSLTGYGRFGGTKTNAEELTRIFDSMQQSGVLVPDRLLTGYIPNADSLNSVCKLVQKLRFTNPNLIYLLDRE